MARLRPSHLLALMFAAIVAVDAQDITVGFVETSYTVTEGGSLEICAEVKEPDDIGEDTLDIEVDPDGDSSLIPGGADNEATPDTVNLFGEYAMMPGADYAPPLPSAADNFEDITQSRRLVCYTLNTYSDDEEEGDEYISLRLMQRGGSTVVFDPLHTLVTIVDDDLTTTPPPVPECPPLVNPANGTVEMSGVTPGSTATYTCDSGFELSGTAILNCGSEGTWDPLPPICMQITCPDLPQPDNGQIQYMGFFPGQQAFVTCEDGFVISGEGVLNCQDTGLWDLAPGVCEVAPPPDCPPLANPANGMVEMSGVAPGSTATYTCNAGYVVNGTDILTCSSEGAWEPQPPTCSQVSCPFLVPPADGNLLLDGFNPGNIAYYSCDVGFIISGVQNLTCQANGQWDHSPPTCDIQCPLLPPPENGGVTLSGFSPGDTTNFSCDAGFSLEGQSVLNCQADGTWDAQLPTCESLVVGLVSRSYDVVEGESIDVCVHIVSPSDIGAVTISLELLPDRSGIHIPADAGEATPDTANIFGEYEMAPGADYPPPLESAADQLALLTQSNRISCYTLRTYDDTEAEGDEFISLQVVRTPDTMVELDPSHTLVRIVDNDSVTCPPLTNPANGAVDVAGTSPGDTATYTCDVGFELDGAAVVECQRNGSWDNPAPVCNIRITAVGFSPVSYTVTEGSSAFAVLIITRTDNIDIPVNVTFATIDGTAEAPSDYIQTVGRVIMEPEEVEVRVSVPITDDEMIEGVQDFTAMLFSDGSPFVKVDNDVALITIIDDDSCPDLSIPNGRIIIGGLTTGDTADYSCDEGYELVGEPTRVCQSDSTWSGEPPTCAAACPILISPGNGSISASSGNLDGDTITFECNDGFTLVGELTLTCGSDGQWSSPMPPVCIPALAIERVNDTVIGDPLFTVALEGGAGSMCYEVRGEPGLYLNLISDTCTSVNALYDSVPGNERLNRMSKIGINAVVYANRIGGCAEIEISVQNCTATLNGFPVDPVAEIGDIRMLKTANHWRVSVSNCERPKAVMWVTCAGEMLRFRIARGSSLAPTSHGLLGQFWGIPVSFSQEIDQPPYIDIFPVGHARHRHVPFFEHDLTWDHSKTTCYYVGNKQGGPELSHDSDESVIEGNFKEYSTGSLFGTAYKYSQFNDDICEVVS